MEWNFFIPGNGLILSELPELAKLYYPRMGTGQTSRIHIY